MDINNDEERIKRIVEEITRAHLNDFLALESRVSEQDHAIVQILEELKENLKEEQNFALTCLGRSMLRIISRVVVQSSILVMLLLSVFTTYYTVSIKSSVTENGADGTEFSLISAENPNPSGAIHLFQIGLAGLSVFGLTPKGNRLFGVLGELGNDPRKALHQLGLDTTEESQ